MKPLQNKVIVKRIQPTLTTESGIILKSTINADEAVVVSVGPDVTDVKPDDIVILDWEYSTSLENDLFVIKDEYIAMVIDRD